MSLPPPTSLAASALQSVRNHRRAHWTHLHVHTLSNGIRVHILPQGNHRIAAVEIWANVGAGNEPSEIAGISHLLEHMMFRGTPSVPDGEFDIQIQALGARANAWTWYDTTAYTAILGSDHLQKLLALEADRFHNLHITDAVFQSERDVVLNERALTADSDPNALAHEHLDRMLFGDGPYARPVIGYKENIAALQRQQLTDWYAQHYAPHALDIFVVGDVDPAQTHHLLEESFGAIVSTTPPSKAEDTQAQHRSDLEETIKLGVAEPLVLMAWGLPQGSDRRALLTWRLLSEILAFGRGGVLRKALEHTQRLALYHDFYVQEHRRGHSAVWEATPRDHVSSRTLVQGFYDTLSQFAHKPLDSDLLEAARIRILSQWASRNAPWQILQQLGDALHTTGDLENYLHDVDVLATIDASDIQHLAAKIADPQYNVLLFVEPEAS